MVKGMMTSATQQEAVARASKVRARSAATRGSVAGAMRRRRAATARGIALTRLLARMIKKQYRLVGRRSNHLVKLNGGGNLLPRARRRRRADGPEPGQAG